MLKSLRKKVGLGGHGFTLVEMMVVLSIMAVMAAIVFPAVTGTTTTSREATQPMDINSVQTGVDRFNAGDTDGSPWPTLAPLSGTDWDAGELPTAADAFTGAGTSGDPYLFDYDSIAGIKWVSPATADGESRTFNPDYVRSIPDHATDTITVTASGTSDVFLIKKGGEDVYVQLSNSSAGNLDFLKWGVDHEGSVWVFVDADSY
jgi:prepilin-type N-terminal cleavage/methylation domain-containing protein